MSKLLLLTGVALVLAGSLPAFAQEAAMKRDARREWRAASQHAPGSAAANADAAIALSESQYRLGGK